MAFGVKVYKNSSFRDKRGYYWTLWKRDLIKNLKFMQLIRILLK